MLNPIGNSEVASLSFRGMVRRILDETNWVVVAAKNAGGIGALADGAGVSRAAVYEWINEYKGNLAHVKVEIVAKVARVGNVGIMELTGIPDIPELATHRRPMPRMKKGKKR